MVVNLLGKQNIAFCKHRDGEPLSPDSTSKQNESNFKSIFKYTDSTRRFQDCHVCSVGPHKCYVF